MGYWALRERVGGQKDGQRAAESPREWGRQWEMWVKRRQGDWGKGIILVAESQERRQDSGGALTGSGRVRRAPQAGSVQSWLPDQVGQDQQPAEGALTGNSGVASIRKGPASHQVPPRGEVSSDGTWPALVCPTPSLTGKKNDSRPWRMGRQIPQQPPHSHHPRNSFFKKYMY